MDWKDTQKEGDQFVDLVQKVVELKHRLNYPQENWTAYTEAQCEEKLLFQDILAELTSTFEDKRKPTKLGGRPALNLNEMVYCCVTKVFEQLSNRRLMGDIHIAYKRGYLNHIPAFTSISGYFRNPELTPILTRLIELSALPLTGFEEVFAADASGLSTAFYSRWFDYRFGHERKYHDWLKIHLMIGTKSQIVTAITITDGKFHDSPQFPYLLEKTRENFNIHAVCADKGYSSRMNVQAIWDIGALPLIPFRENSTSKKMGSDAWRKMYLFYNLKRDEFMKVYHRRSLVEATFSALKRKFQGKLMNRSEVGKINEALCKVLAYNICVLIHEAKVNGIDISIAEQKPAELNNNLPNSA